jgi:hypothetical protein
MKVIFRLKKIKNKKTITSWQSHNFRYKFQQNIKKEESHKNVVLMDSLFMKDKSKTIDIDAYYKSKEAKIKVGNVLAIDGIISMSPDFFGDKSEKDIEDWANHQVKFINEYFDNVKEMVLHLDEKTPHIHFLVTTERKTQKNYSNQYKKTTIESVTLNTKWMNKIALSQLQESIYTHNKGKYSYIQQRTIKNKEQVKRSHVPLKEYYASIANKNKDLNDKYKELEGKYERLKLLTNVEQKVIQKKASKLY